MKMIDKIKVAVASLAVLTAGVVAAPAAMATVTCPSNTIRKNEVVDTYAQCNVEKDEANKSLMDRMKTIINFVLAAIGAVTVVMIIVGGVQYTTSSGDAGRVKKAKDTIMYGIIGLVIAILAAAIVNFVLGGLFS